MHVYRPDAARRSLRRCLCTALALAAAACGGGGDGGTDPQPPVVTGLNPVSVVQYDEDFLLAVSGSGFALGAVVRWNGSDRPTRFVSASQVTAEITNADLQQPGIVQVSVSGGSAGVSNSMGLTVLAPTPRVLFTVPDRVVLGTGPFTLRVIGDGFSQGSVVRWNGSARATTFVDPGEVTAQIANLDIQQAGLVQVSVFTPVPGGGTSNNVALQVEVPPNPPTMTTGISPGVVLAGVGGTVTVTGTWFIPSTRVVIAGMSAVPAVTVVSGTELRFTLTPDNMPAAGFAQVSVFNPPPGGGTLSSPLSLRVDNPVPVITGVSPAGAVEGQGSQVVRITGTGFVPGSYIRFDDGGRGPGYVSPTELQLVLEARDLDQAGTFPIGVTNFGPGGGVSNTLTFTVRNPPAN